MSYEQVAVLGILVLALAGFIWGRFRYDLVAIAALIAAVGSGVVPAEEAFLGFGHPATITVIAVLILSRACRTRARWTQSRAALRRRNAVP